MSILWFLRNSQLMCITLRNFLKSRTWTYLMNSTSCNICNQWNCINFVKRDARWMQAYESCKNKVTALAMCRVICGIFCRFLVCRLVLLFILLRSVDMFALQPPGGNLVDSFPPAPIWPRKWIRMAHTCICFIQEYQPCGPNTTIRGKVGPIQNEKTNENIKTTGIPIHTIGQFPIIHASSKPEFLT